MCTFTSSEWAPVHKEELLAITMTTHLLLVLVPGKRAHIAQFFPIKRRQEYRRVPLAIPTNLGTLFPTHMINRSVRGWGKERKANRCERHQHTDCRQRGGSHGSYARQRGRSSRSRKKVGTHGEDRCTDPGHDLLHYILCRLGVDEDADGDEDAERERDEHTMLGLTIVRLVSLTQLFVDDFYVFCHRLGLRRKRQDPSAM